MHPRTNRGVLTLQLPQAFKRGLSSVVSSCRRLVVNSAKRNRQPGCRVSGRRVHRHCARAARCRAVLHALTPRVLGQRIEAARIGNPFVVRTFDPPITAIVGLTVNTLRRLGKRIVFGLDEDLVIVHLMIAGRFRWRQRARRFRERSGSSPSISPAARFCSRSRDRSARPPCTSSAANRRLRNTIPAASRSSPPTSRDSHSGSPPRTHAQAGADRPKDFQRDRQRTRTRSFTPRSCRR